MSENLKLIIYFEMNFPANLETDWIPVYFWMNEKQLFIPYPYRFSVSEKLASVYMTESESVFWLTTLEYYSAFWLKLINSSSSIYRKINSAFFPPPPPPTFPLHNCQLNGYNLSFAIRDYSILSFMTGEVFGIEVYLQLDSCLYCSYASDDILHK